MTPYLIQRMIKQKDPQENPTIDQLYKMDYMGSSEFEWGALPKSLKLFTKNFGNLTIDSSEIKNFKNEFLYLLGMKDVINFYKPFIPDIINGKSFLKERMECEPALKGNFKFYNNEVIFDENKHPSAWWDIDYNIMMTFGLKNVKELMLSIGATRDKKKLEKMSEWY